MLHTCAANDQLKLQVEDLPMGHTHPNDRLPSNACEMCFVIATVVLARSRWLTDSKHLGSVELEGIRWRSNIKRELPLIIDGKDR